ncbi:MAG: ferredoxin family protein [Methanosarcinales archaeon]|jgi:NAD-dependent dihydropyrimidine dehydrogenase PreA subunit|nr:ferredoxin family protein [Methanosarcinales archaeon]
MSELQEKQSPYPVIHALECKACGRCILDCPRNVLEPGTVLNERGYMYAAYKGEGCSGCGNCYYTCPEPNAIEVHVPKKAKAET